MFENAGFDGFYPLKLGTQNDSVRISTALESLGCWNKSNTASMERTTVPRFSRVIRPNRGQEVVH